MPILEFAFACHPFGFKLGQKAYIPILVHLSFKADVSLKFILQAF
jgi:hypothetical protein